MSRRIQIIRRTFNEQDGLHSMPVRDTIVRVFGRGGVATSPDTDSDLLLFFIAQMLTGEAVDQRGWELNGKCSTEFSNIGLSRTLRGGNEYSRPARKSKPVEEIALDAKEVILRGQVVWRCAKNGSVVFPSFRQHYNDLTAAELLITCAVHLLPIHMRERLTTPAWERQALGRVNRQPSPAATFVTSPEYREAVDFVTNEKAARRPRWVYKHEGD